jgi:hypothetical protein
LGEFDPVVMDAIKILSAKGGAMANTFLEDIMYRWRMALPDRKTGRWRPALLR